METFEGKDQAVRTTKRSVAVFGGGIAGLAAAHELTRLGWSVSVYEANRDAGGFFRSARLEDKGNMPTEYSWHGFGPWYHNVFDILKQIPFDDSASLYEKSLSRPIDFGIAPDEGEAQFIRISPFLSAHRMLRMQGLDLVRWTWMMAKTWAAHRRSLEHYTRLNAAEQYRPPVLNPVAWRTWRATFGPWIGSDWKNASLHTMGDFFRKLLISKPAHYHKADDEGPAWRHGQGDNWLLLLGPSNEFWFQKWVAHLEKSGVRFYWENLLYKLHYDGRNVTGARLASGEEVSADAFILAVNPFAAAEILRRTPELAEKDQLRLFDPLIQEGPHTQVSFRIAFSEKIYWPRKRAAVIIPDSEYNLTLSPEDQIWAPDVDLGEGVAALWTVTACVGDVPGRIYKKPVEECSREEFLEEVKAQIFSCQALDGLIREANGGRSLTSFPILRIEIWHEWRFSPDGIQTHQPKWVNSTRTNPFRPTQVTPVPNLALAGAHTRTAADVWSIEGATESGRRAAKVFAPEVKVLPQYNPWWLRWVWAVDDLFFARGWPHALSAGLAALGLTALFLGAMISFF